MVERLRGRRAFAERLLSKRWRLNVYILIND